MTSDELKLSLIRQKNSTDRWLLISCYSENDLILIHHSEIFLTKTNFLNRNIETFGNGDSRTESHTFRPFFFKLSCRIILEVLFYLMAIFVVNDALAGHGYEYSRPDIRMRRKDALNISRLQWICIKCQLYWRYIKVLAFKRILMQIHRDLPLITSSVVFF